MSLHQNYIPIIGCVLSVSDYIKKSLRMNRLFFPFPNSSLLFIQGLGLHMTGLGGRDQVVE